MIKKCIVPLIIWGAVISCNKNDCNCYGDKYERTIKKSHIGVTYNTSEWKFIKKERVKKRDCNNTSDLRESSTEIDFLGDRTITEIEYRQIKCSED